MLTGVVVGLVVAVPAVAAEVRLTPGADLQLVLYVVLLAGLVLGGLVAGRGNPDAALTAGAFAGLLAFLLIQGAAVVIGQLNDRPFPPPLRIAYNTVMAGCAGIFGGFLASLRRRPPTDVGEPLD